MEFKNLPPEESVPLSRQIISQYGWNTTCYQILNIGMQRELCLEVPALIGHVTRARHSVVAGAPVCPPDQLKAVIVGWENHCKAIGKQVCYFGAESRVLRVTRELGGHSEVILGAQPNWDPRHWEETAMKHASFRAQLNRAKNKGVRIEEWQVDRAQNNLELHRVLSEWLETRGLPTMHFLVEPQTLGDLEGRRIFVALIQQKPVAFLVLSPIPQRKGYLTEQFPRGFQAPNGTVELLMDSGIRAIERAGAEYLTMGIVPLSEKGVQPLHSQLDRDRAWRDHFDIPEPSSAPNPMWLNGVLGWVRAHGRRFYNFSGLDAFKSKFWPHAWEPIYAISNQKSFSPMTLYAIAAAFSDGSPVGSVARAMLKAGKQEMRWAKERVLNNGTGAVR